MSNSTVSVIKYEGDNSTFIWKHPCEDFNSLTQLIVHESQEAIFLMNGEALDVFRAGKHTLETQNIPKISKFFGLVTDKNSETPFHCEVYFVNQTVQMDLKWGTDSKVRYVDPEYGLPLELGASGSMNLKVSDSMQLLLKLVGTMNGIAWGEGGSNFTKSLQNSFRPMISNAVKSNLTPAIKESRINLLEIDEHLEELSAILHKKILPGFEEYGLTIPQFYLTTVVLPEDNPNFKKIRDLHTIAFQKRVMQAEADVRSAKIKTDAEVRTTQVETEAQVQTLQAEKKAQVTAAERIAELEKQTTETEIAKREAERQMIAAQVDAAASALKTREQGLAEAEVMRAKGYSEKDLIEAGVQKAYAEGLGKFGSNAGGSSGGGGGNGIANDMISMMTGMKVAETMLGKMDGFMGKIGGNQTTAAPAPAQTVNAAAEQKATCSGCGAEIPQGSKFCLQCGKKVDLPNATKMILCPGCGKTVPEGKFCSECGTPFARKCPNCGVEAPAGSKFCNECGTKL
ncbi:SPFH domain-containing protein [bacterium]|nr:SPFH domain-containing protein [bacterium]